MDGLPSDWLPLLWHIQPGPHLPSMDGSARQQQSGGQNRHWNLQGCEGRPKTRDRRAWHGENARTRTEPSKQAALHYPITPSADQVLVFTGSGEWHNYNLKGAINHRLVVHCLVGAAYSMSTWSHRSTDHVNCCNHQSPASRPFIFSSCSHSRAHARFPFSVLFSAQSPPS